MSGGNTSITNWQVMLITPRQTGPSAFEVTFVNAMGNGQKQEGAPSNRVPRATVLLENSDGLRVLSYIPPELDIPPFSQSDYEQKALEEVRSYLEQGGQ